MISEILILKKYNLEIIQVVKDTKNKNEKLKEAFLGHGKLINSDFLNGLEVISAKEKIINTIEKKVWKKKGAI